MNYGNQFDPILMAAYIALELLKPIFVLLVIGAVLWVIARFLVNLFSVDGGHGRREQRQRHRLQMLILGIAVGCGVTGVWMSMNGYAEGRIIIDLPGGMKIHNGGMAAVFTSAMLFILWVLVKMLIETKATIEHSRETEPAESRRATDQVSVPRVDLTPAGNVLGNVTFAKAGIVTIILLPFVGPVALFPGGFLAYKAWQRQQRISSLRMPPRLE